MLARFQICGNCCYYTTDYLSYQTVLFGSSELCWHFTMETDNSLKMKPAQVVVHAIDCQSIWGTFVIFWLYKLFLHHFLAACCIFFVLRGHVWEQGVCSLPTESDLMRKTPISLLWKCSVQHIWDKQASARHLPALGLGSRSGTGVFASCWPCWPGTLRPGPLAAWAPCPQTPGCGAAGRFRNTPRRRRGHGSRRTAASRSLASPGLAWWWTVYLRRGRTASNRIA